MRIDYTALSIGIAGLAGLGSWAFFAFKLVGLLAR